MNFIKKWIQKRKYYKAYRDCFELEVDNSTAETATGRFIDMQPVWEKVIKLIEDNETK
jgi:hypothetical protein